MVTVTEWWWKELEQYIKVKIANSNLSSKSLKSKHSIRKFGSIWLWMEIPHIAENIPEESFPTGVKKKKQKKKEDRKDI